MINPKVFKQVRKRLGLSQQQLADALGLSRVTVNKMERGRLKNGIPDEIGARLLAIKRPLLADTKPPERTKAARGHEAIAGPNLQLTDFDDSDLWDNEEDES